MAGDVKAHAAWDHSGTVEGETETGVTSESATPRLRTATETAQL